MQTETRTSLVFDLADMISGLPPAIAGGLAGISSPTASVAPGAVPRQNRRLPERILVAAHQACDLGDLDVATQLLSILETVVGQAKGPVDSTRRRVMESLIAAHQRLWHLRYSGTAGLAATVIPIKPSQGFHESFHESFDMTNFQPTA